MYACIAWHSFLDCTYSCSIALLMCPVAICYPKRFASNEANLSGSFCFVSNQRHWVCSAKVCSG